MPRRKRSLQKAISEDMESLTPQEEANLVTWHTHETPRFKCPLCGMTANTDNLLKAPHDLVTAVQRWGGSFPGYMRKQHVDRETGEIIIGRPVRRGYIQYFDLPEDDARILAAQMIPIVEGVLGYLRDFAGISPDEVEPLQATPSLPIYEPPGYSPDLLEEGQEEYDEDLMKMARQNVQRRLANERKNASRALPKGKPEQPRLESKPPQKRLPSGQTQKRLPSATTTKALPPPRKL